MLSTINIYVPDIGRFCYARVQKPCQTHQNFPSIRKMMKNFDREKTFK